MRKRLVEGELASSYKRIATIRRQVFLSWSLPDYRSLGVENNQDKLPFLGEMWPSYSVSQHTPIRMYATVNEFRTTSLFAIAMSFPVSSSTLMSASFEETVSRGRPRWVREGIRDDLVPFLFLFFLDGLLHRCGLRVSKMRLPLWGNVGPPSQFLNIRRYASAGPQFRFGQQLITQ